MQQIKMIGLDLDGTLLNTKKELTENTRRVLDRKSTRLNSSHGKLSRMPSSA